MEDKRISEKESLELIARMIKETQQNVAHYAAYPLLIWGYTTVAVTIAIWFAFQETQSYKVNYLWFALPVIAAPLSYYFRSKEGGRGTRTYMDRITTQIWMVFGLTAWGLSCTAFIIRINILFLIPLLMGMACILTGCVIKYKPLIVAGIIGTVLSFLQLFITGMNQLWVFAAIFVIMMIIPGHILNKKMKQCLKN